MLIHDTFETGMDPRWQVSEVGRGRVTQQDNALHLTQPITDDSAYSNAQISDYKTHERDFTLKPPLRLTVRGYTTLPLAEMRGTAGFGFWNHPFEPGTWDLRIPQALWFFFAAPPNDMALAQGVPGHGWKAATFNARRWPFYALLPTAPLAMPLMHIQPLYKALWPLGQQAIGVSETLLDAALLHTAHTYTLEWQPQSATFYVDGQRVLHAVDGIPQAALGFVAWNDNQYAVVSPKGRFQRGLVSIPQPQTLVLDEVRIDQSP